MIDLDVVRSLMPLGVGGLLAAVIFHFYRQDFLRERTSHHEERERLERREDRLLQALEHNAAAYERLSATIDGLAAIITERRR